MIAPIFSQANRPVRLEGYAYDYNCRICAVDFSLDEGKHWTRYCTPHTSEDLWVRWVFDFTPHQPGAYRLKARSVAISGEISPAAAVAELIVE